MREVVSRVWAKVDCQGGVDDDAADDDGLRVDVGDVGGAGGGFEERVGGVGHGVVDCEGLEGWSASHEEGGGVEDTRVLDVAVGEVVGGEGTAGGAEEGSVG